MLSSLCGIFVSSSFLLSVMFSSIKAPCEQIFLNCYLNTITVITTSTKACALFECKIQTFGKLHGHACNTYSFCDCWKKIKCVDEPYPKKLKIEKKINKKEDV